MAATTINEVLEKADMEFLSASEQECEDILDSVQDSTDVECNTKSEKPIHHTRKTFKLEKNKGKRSIWGSLPFGLAENANEGQSMGVKVGRCDGESTIVGCSVRDLMRRKRLHRREPPKVKIHHDVMVTPDKESNKRIISSPKKKVFNTKFSLPSFLKQVKKLTDSQKDSIERAGFGSLLRIPDQVLRRSHLIHLMEKWSCEKQAFIFPPGELKITLLDVSLILGLRVIGQPVVLKEGAPLTSLEKEFGASVSNRAISIELLKERFESVGERDDESFVRIFLLYCFGTLLFPSANGKVDSRYLYLLQDVDSVSSFAWGAAVLEDLNKGLSQRIRKKTSNIGGCLILLQIWCYEHIIIGRPKLLDDPSKFPRACRWESSARSYLTSSQFNINFEELEHTQILWKLEPTSEEIEIDIIREIPQEWYLRSGPGTIEQPIEVQSERAIRMVGLRKKKVEEEEEEPLRQERSTILVISDDEESRVIEDLQKEIIALKVIIEERKEEQAKKIVEVEDDIKDLRKKVQDGEEQRKRVQDENEELRKRVQYEEELRKRVQDDNEKLKKRVQNENEELRKRVQNEVEIRKGVQNENEELLKRVQDEGGLRKRVQNENENLMKVVQDEEELRKRVEDENKELRNRVQDVEELRIKVQYESEELRKKVQNEKELRKRVQDDEKFRKRIEDENEELRKRVQDVEELRKRVQDESEKLRKRVQNELEELRKTVQDEEELRKRVQAENEELTKRVHDEEELRHRVEVENEELTKQVQDEVEQRKRVEDENVEMRKRVEYEEELRKRVEDEHAKLRDEYMSMEGGISDLGRLLLNDDSVDL